jgi:hypothetical protein
LQSYSINTEVRPNCFRMFGQHSHDGGSLLVASFPAGSSSPMTIFEFIFGSLSFIFPFSPSPFNHILLSLLFFGTLLTLSFHLSLFSLFSSSFNS